MLMERKNSLNAIPLNKENAEGVFTPFPQSQQCWATRLLKHMLKPLNAPLLKNNPQF